MYPEPGYAVFLGPRVLHEVVPEVCGAGMSEKARWDTRRIRRMMQFIQQNFREARGVTPVEYRRAHGRGNG